MSLATQLAARAREQSDALRLPLVRGEWFPIRLVPDPLIGDRFNVGVAFVDEGGVVRCRMADEFSRLKCLYGGRVDVDSFAELIELVEADMAGTAWTYPGTPLSENIQFGTPVPATGFSVDEILDRHFTELVPFGASHRAGLGATVPVATDALKAQVMKDLRARYGMRAETLFRGGPIQLPDEYGRARKLRLPLHDATTGHAGDIVSAFSAQTQTATRALNGAMVNLLALRLVERERPLGLFLLEPGAQDFAGRDLRAVHEAVDAAAALARGAGVHVARKGDRAALADSIVEWAAA